MPAVIQCMRLRKECGLRSTGKGDSGRDFMTRGIWHQAKSEIRGDAGLSAVSKVGLITCLVLGEASRQLFESVL